MAKKVAIIIERADVALGGAERSVFELAGALAMLGIETDILAAKGHTNTKNINILCDNHSGKRVCFLTFAKALKKHLAGNHYDIVHSTLPFDFADIYQPRGGSFTETILQNAASYENKTVAAFKKITAFANFRRTILLQAERKLCKKQDGPIVAALSEYVAKQFREHYNLQEARIKIIPNGVKTNKKIDIAEADKLRWQILSKLSLKEPDSPVFFLFVANNFRLKGLTPLIKALSQACEYKTERKPYLIVAGSGKSGKYRHLAKKLNVHQRLIFLGKIRHIQNALSIIDVAVLPTFYDPSSRYILEALTAGKPVITTKFNGASESFTNNKHGITIDKPQNIDSLTKAIVHFTNTDNIEAAANAIEEDKIKEKVSIDRVANQLKTLYDSILRSN